MRKTILTTVVALAIAAAILANLASAGSAATFNSHSGAFVPTPAVAGADVVTDWNRTMIAGLEAVNPPPPLANADRRNRPDFCLRRRQRDRAALHVRTTSTRRRRAVRRAPLRPQALPTRHWWRCCRRRSRSSTSRCRRRWRRSPTILPTRANRSLRGLDWGKTVANDILAWRATDGINAVLPPYVPADCTRRLPADAAALRAAAVPPVREHDSVRARRPRRSSCPPGRRRSRAHATRKT